jgi:light-regulated signal transduction histidine kinase (bacteriophytochrome)
VSDLAILIEQSNCEIKVDELPVIKGDKSQLGRLFQNLIQNAIKFTLEGRKPVINIEYKKGEDCHYVYVRDNGIGFEQEYAERIFRLFERLNGRNEYKGTGLGLAIVKKIMERHGGEVEAFGEIDKGAKFKLSFPMET